MSGKASERAEKGEAEEGLPRFARAVAAQQSCTSPFAAPLPALASGGGSSGCISAAGAAGKAAAAVDTGPWRPELNIFEDGAGWMVEVALPGVRPGDVQVELAGRVLAVSGWRRGCAAQGDTILQPSLATLLPAALGLPAAGVRSPQAGAQAQAVGAFSARWTLPAEADTDSLAAVFQNGVLRIRVGRREL